jgi:hypothetical protein
MPAILDAAILKALSLDTSTTRIFPISGGSGFTTVAKISTSIDGEKKAFFMKVGQGKEAELMFKGELVDRVGEMVMLYRGLLSDHAAPGFDSRC